jgi:hypothetical protein
MGLPGIDRNAEFPTAAPVQDGAAMDVVVEPLVLTLKVSVAPSDRVKLKFCPAADRAVASL